MNENPPYPQPTYAPPTIPPQRPPVALTPLGEDPDDRTPIGNPGQAIESLLRQPRRVMFQLTQPGAGMLIGWLGVVAIVCALLYGLVTGSFSMGEQLWAAPLKVALGLFLSLLICLPSLYIFTCLSGAETRLSQIVGLACGMAMLITLLLVGFAPVAWLFSQSTESLAWMGALHLFFLLIALAFGARFLSNALRHCRARSFAAVGTWLVIFVLVVLQMTTTLRPLLGKADTFLPQEKKFFLRHWADHMVPGRSD